jgi:UDP-glucuronate 4-epimerase
LRSRVPTILLTGAAGFIGHRTALRLLEQGFRVVGVDNFNDYYDVRLKRWRAAELSKHAKLDVRELDIEDGPALDRLFAAHKFDAVVNLAARAGVRYSMENPRVYFTTNAMGTLNVLESMRRHGVQKLVLASTSSLYAGQPMPFDESLPVNTPISPYAASKKAAEMLCYTWHHLYKVDVSVVRYFTVYGPAGRPDMSYFRFIRWIDEGAPLQLFGDGTQARDFTYVDDIAQGTVLALKPVGYEVINLGGGNRPVALSTLIEKLERLLGKTANIHRGAVHIADVKETWASIDKAERLLGWKPALDLDEGLRRTVAWYRENRELVMSLSLEEAGRS